jgi:CelD/BcsL family acetyltransferase involved in cellulose biosynthesis
MSIMASRRVENLSQTDLFQARMAVSNQTHQKVAASEFTPPLASEGRALTVRRLGSWDELRELAPAWNDFLRASSAATICLTWEWLNAWWESYGATLELFLLACFDGEGRLAGLAPFYRTTRRVGKLLRLRAVRFIGDGSDDSEDLHFICRPGAEAEAIAALLDWFTRNPSVGDILELNFLRSESPAAGALESALAARGWVSIRTDIPRLIIPLPDDWTSYLNSLNKGPRKSLAYTLRRIHRPYKVRLRRCRSASELREFLDRLFEFHTERWQTRGETGVFRRPSRRRFFEELCRRTLAAGTLDLWLLDLDGHSSAAEIGFRFGTTYYALQAGFDPAYAKHSPGVVLMAMVLQELIPQGIREYDFLAWEEPSKLMWGPEKRSYTNLVFAAPGSRGARYLRAKRSAVTVKEGLRARVPAGLWEPLRRAYRRIRPYPSSDIID